MAARKLQQEIDKCFKKITEGVAEFDSTLDKIEQSTNAAQKDKLEIDLKREIKKLQRLRDQVKSWAQSNDIKDKAPLLEQRARIETKMETFKAVEKAMKTKAYSKEGLSAATKLDPKEQAKVDAGTFLSDMVDELEQQIEALETESETLQATGKKGKNQNAKADRIAAIDAIIERHKWQQGKLELIRRSLENGGVETEQVFELEEMIRYYVSDGMNDDFLFDEDMYEDLNLDGDEDAFGMNMDNDRGGSSQDTKSERDDTPHRDEEPLSRSVPPQKPRSVAENAIPATTRRGGAAQTKSPLPALATLHTPLPTICSSGTANAVPMKPASVPTRPAGEGLKYASAAAAGAASDRNVGIAPLPPPPGLGPLPQAAARSSAANSPALTSAQPVANQQVATSPALSLARTVHSANSPAPATQPTPKTEPARLARTAAAKAAATPQAPPTPAPEPAQPAVAPKTEPKPPAPQVNGTTDAGKAAKKPPQPQQPQQQQQQEDSESVYYLPPGLQDALESFEAVHKRPLPATAPASMQMLEMSHRNCPTGPELSTASRHYRPEMPLLLAGNDFPMEPLDLLDDPRLYKTIDPDTLFFAFYYQQGSLHQHLAAKSLKEQSWRFHKQYQTWFQRHEEPKEITDDYELGAYRFFDYESTWMNRRKTDFRFTYRYLEDEQDMAE